MSAPEEVTLPSPLTSAASSCAPVAAIRNAKHRRRQRDRGVRGVWMPSRSGSQYAVTDAMPDASEAVPAIVGGVVLVGLIWSGAVDF